MSNISTVEAKLPPGFRFHPRDDELVCDYLMKKASDSRENLLLIEVDLNKCEPWDIPETACVGGKEWYFYSLRERKYATGIRTNRATASGYWKATGKDRAIFRKGRLVGMRKTLVFYQGRAPKGKKTDWVMHEFRMEGSSFASPTVSSLKEDWVLCRVFCKIGEALSAQQSMGSSIDDDIGSSSLPPLMDSYITFDNQTQPIHFHTQFDGDDHEQVPCFSIFSSQQQEVVNDLIPTNTTYPHIFSHMQQLPNIDISTTQNTFGKIPVVGNACSDVVDPFSWDTKVVKAVLNQLTKIESNNNNHTVKGSSPSLGEPRSESHLSEAGMPTNMWYHF